MAKHRFVRFKMVTEIVELKGELEDILDFAEYREKGKVIKTLISDKTSHVTESEVSFWYPELPIKVENLF